MRWSVAPGQTGSSSAWATLMRIATSGLVRGLLNVVGGLLRRIGVRWPGLDPQEFLSAAQRRTGLSDWGDDRFRQGLRVLVEAFDRQDSAHAFGRLFFREFCIRLLVNRLRIQA